MKKLDTKQISFLKWIIDTKDNTIHSTISEIILEQDVYGPKLQIILNELVDIYKQEYIKHTNTWA